MSALTLPKNFGAPSKLFAGKAKANDDLAQGVASSFGVISYRGKVWAIKYQGKETPLMRDDGDGPRGSIEVVIAKASSAISKIFYKGGYTDGQNAAPDCWSGNGVTPDSSVQNKVHPTCAGCPMNAWGSRITEAGKQGKACQDLRRLAVVPANDIANEMMGGPMLLRVPAASLKDLKAYGEMLNGYGYPYYAVVTKISFDAKEAYPKFVFSAVRPLEDHEAKEVLAVQKDDRTARLIDESIENRAAQPAEADDEEEAPRGPFEQPVKAKPAAAPAAAPKAEPKKAAKKAAPPPEPEDDEDEGEEDEEQAVGKAPDSFDDMLNNLL